MDDWSDETRSRLNVFQATCVQNSDRRGDEGIPLRHWLFLGKSQGTHGSPFAKSLVVDDPVLNAFFDGGKDESELHGPFGASFAIPVSFSSTLWILSSRH